MVTPARAKGILPLLLAAAVGGLAYQATPALPQQVDLEKIFTCEDQDTLPMAQCNAGKELVMTNCVACHAFVQIVLRQYDEGGWHTLLNRHRERVPHLSGDEVENIKQYLAAKFNPDREPPELPPEILEALTDY